MIIDRVLPALPQSVPAARRLVIDALADLPPDTVNEIELMVSELVTNCVLHAQTPFRLTVDRTHQEIRIEVTDDASSDPRVRHPGAADPHGRGLQLVDSFAHQWGVIRTSADAGKTVWFTINLALSNPGLESTHQGAAGWSATTPASSPGF